MTYYDVVLKIGQVWVHEISPHVKYEIVDIVVDEPADEGIYGVYADEYSEGCLVRQHCRLGYCLKDGKPYGWMTGWGLSKPSKIRRFSYVSRRSLRKKVREQMAGSLLVEKL